MRRAELGGSSGVVRCAGLALALVGGCGDDGGGQGGATDTIGTSASATLTGPSSGSGATPTSGGGSGGTATAGSGTATSSGTTAGTDTAGTTGSTGGSATGNSSGNGSDTGEPAGQYCTERCTRAEDCRVGGMDLGIECDEGRCISAASRCTDDAPCVDLFSGFTPACGSDADCSGRVCVDRGGVGRCATAPSEFLSCDQLQQTEVELPRFPGGGLVTVCANERAACNQALGFCFLPCRNNGDCAASAPFDTCNVATGLCGCSDDRDCDGVAGGSVCVDGTCRCTSDTECRELTNADTCYAGVCGCSSVAVCTATPVYDGTVVGCDAP